MVTYENLGRFHQATGARILIEEEASVANAAGAATPNYVREPGSQVAYEGITEAEAFINQWLNENPETV